MDLIKNYISNRTIENRNKLVCYYLNKLKKFFKTLYKKFNSIISKDSIFEFEDIECMINIILVNVIDNYKFNKYYDDNNIKSNDFEYNLKYIIQLRLIDEIRKSSHVLSRKEIELMYKVNLCDHFDDNNESIKDKFDTKRKYINFITRIRFKKQLNNNIESNDDIQNEIIYKINLERIYKYIDSIKNIKHRNIMLDIFNCVERNKIKCTNREYYYTKNKLKEKVIEILFE